MSCIFMVIYFNRQRLLHRTTYHVIGYRVHDRVNCAIQSQQYGASPLVKTQRSPYSGISDWLGRAVIYKMKYNIVKCTHF